MKPKSAHIKSPHIKPANPATTAAASLALSRDALVAAHHLDPAIATLTLLAHAWSSLAPSSTSSPSPRTLLEDLPPVLNASSDAPLDARASALLLSDIALVHAHVEPRADSANSPNSPAFSLAIALECIYEALLLRDASAIGSTRARLGAVYTPRPLALTLTRDAWSRLAPASRPLILDPSCGSGRFLLASVDIAAAINAPLPILHAFDIDPCAIFITRALLHTHPLLASERDNASTIAARIRWCDGLTTPSPPAAFHLVLGNPPFLNQLAQTSARAASHARALNAATQGVIKGYADTASAFLHRAITLTAPAGITCMIQPLSVLATRDSRPLRAWCSRTATLESIWVGDTHAFAASVHVCALTLRKRDHAQRPRDARPRDPLPNSLSITLSRGVPPRNVARVRATPSTRWSVLAARACGVPNLCLDPRLPTLRTWLDATADFRDVYYALRDLIVDAPNPPSNSNLIPILNTGLIELAATHWGRTPARMYRARWLRPAFDLTQAQQHPFLARVLPLRLRPKIILATQTRIIEAFVDHLGTWMPTTPLISLTPRDNAPDLDTIAAALCSPVTTLVAARRTFGTSMSPRAIKLAAREVLDLPIPTDPARLAPAAASLRQAALAHANADLAGYDAALHAYAQHAVAAFALTPRDHDLTLAWWHARRAPRNFVTSR